MSKRAEQAALEAYPVHSVLIQPARGGGYYADGHFRKGFIKGYKQAANDTLDRVSDWLRENIQDYLFMSNGEPHIAINGVIEIMRGTIKEEE